LERLQALLQELEFSCLMLGVRLPAAVVIVRWRHHVPVRSPDGVFVDPLPQAIDFALFFATRPGAARPLLALHYAHRSPQAASKAPPRPARYSSAPMKSRASENAPSRDACSTARSHRDPKRAP